MFLPPTALTAAPPEPDRTLRKAETYELARSLREADELARARRKARRTLHLGPRTGLRRPLGAQLRLVLRRA